MNCCLQLVTVRQAEYCGFLKGEGKEKCGLSEGELQSRVATALYLGNKARASCFMYQLN